MADSRKESGTCCIPNNRLPPLDFNIFNLIFLQKSKNFLRDLVCSVSCGRVGVNTNPNDNGSRKLPVVVIVSDEASYINR